MFRHGLDEGEARTIGVSWIRFAQRLHAFSDDAIFAEYPQLFDCISDEDLDPDATAAALCNLLQRHSETILGVLSTMLTRESEALSAGTLPETSLLRLLVGSDRPLGPATLTVNSIRRDGRAWIITFDGQSITVTKRLGPQYLALLFSHPGQEFHVDRLVAGGNSEVPALPEAEDLRRTRSPREPIADEQAIGEWKERLAQLESEPTLKADLRREAESLRRALAQAIGLRGRFRSFPTKEEQNRQSVSKALNAVLKDVETYHPALGRHLRKALSIGVNCIYDPDPPVIWET